ncbi:SusC/RagA family TonB-linked outer membrane protein [Polaribacter sp. IC073]|uniref:SusC/RagA family TonB-linked outer membrane protein n=1 Tax=Polaribacter sp. IC073 TaxID=2508540 RepID=UPI0016782CAA|nr:SusC/RagA family TonB-linked outer membrane protein [Polaribacter sp. IC073]
MKTKFNGILTLFLAFVVQISFAQQKTVSGTVSDDSGVLPGVSILIKGSNIGTESDFDGKYSIKTAMGDVLVFRYLGYKIVEKTIGNSNTVNATLVQDASVLNEIVVTTYGSQTKESLTGSITEIKTEEFAKVASGNAVTGLTGKVAGVQIYSNSGQPGAAPTVRFRGIGSLNGSSSPLYVVDGVPFNESITTINPNDIASMSFVKDASAASLYGNRGANGVIIVTTKKGKKGKINVSLDIKTTFSSRAIDDYAVIKDAGEYYETYHKMLKGNQITDNGLSDAAAGAFASNNLISGASLGLIYNTFGGDNSTLVDPSTGRLTRSNPLWTVDWEDALFNQTSGIKSQYLSVSGGTDSTNYFFSVGNEDNDGYNINTGFKRYTLKTSVDTQVNKSIKIGSSLSYANRTQTGQNENNITGSFAWVRNIAPIYPVYTLDHNTGVIQRDNQGKPLYDAEANISPNALAGRPFNGFSNPLAIQELNVNEVVNDNFNNRTYAEIDLFKDLKFTYSFGLDLRNYNTTDYTNKLIGSGIAPNARITTSYGRSVTFTNQQLVNWNKTFGDNHNVAVLLGHESSSNSSQFMSGSKKDQFISSDLSLDLFAENDGAGNLGGGGNNYTLDGYFARVLYDFNNKYFVNASFRRDGSSVFHPDNRWGNFYGGGLWAISKEDFMSNISWLDNLKLKGSYGQLGNDYVAYDGGGRNYTPFLDQWDVVSDGLEFSLSKTVLGNKDIKWETSTNMNAGFEAAMFDRRLRVEAEYFQRKISDLIFNRPLSPSSGLPSVPENVMDMQNTGVEVSIGYDIITNTDFSWFFDINATHYKNEITKLAPGREFIDNGIYRWVDGGSAYDYYTQKFAGVNPTTGMTQWFTKEEFDGTTPTNGITEKRSLASLYYLDKTALPDVYGGFSTSMIYKDFDFSVNFSYQIGGYAYDNVYAGGFSGKTGQNFSKDFDKTWRYDNQTGTLPRVLEGSTNYSRSDFFLEKSTYLSLNDITVGYTLPKDISTRYGINSVRLYGLANNLGLWATSDRQGFDPRASVTGGTSAVRYSSLKTFTLGLNINF